MPTTHEVSRATKSGGPTLSTPTHHTHKPGPHVCMIKLSLLSAKILAFIKWFSTHTDRLLKMTHSTLFPLSV